jgi:hypothetical protein
MYTNIDIDNSTNQMSNFLADIWDKYDCTAVKEAIEIVMKNNGMQFGDLIYHKIHSVAMGMLPAPTIDLPSSTLQCNLQAQPHCPSHWQISKDSLMTDLQSVCMT